MNRFISAAAKIVSVLAAGATVATSIEALLLPSSRPDAELLKMCFLAISIFAALQARRVLELAMPLWGVEFWITGSGLIFFRATPFFPIWLLLLGANALALLLRKIT